MTLASFNLIQSTVSEVVTSMGHFVMESGSVSEQLESIRRLYEVKNIRNRIKDGTESYPENSETLKSGISVEFRSACRIPEATQAERLTVYIEMYRSSIPIATNSHYAKFPSKLNKVSFV